MGTYRGPLNPRIKKLRKAGRNCAYKEFIVWWTAVTEISIARVGTEKGTSAGFSKG